MPVAFKKAQFKDINGKTPSDYIAELLAQGELKVMRLATYVSLIPNEGVLIGTPVYKMRSPAIGIWVRSRGRYHLFYSYFKQRNEVCFLYFFQGIKPENRLDEVIDRVKLFYDL